MLLEEDYVAQRVTAARDFDQGRYNRALLDVILAPMRLAARQAGYAITVHGSMNRDIDLVAIPWIEDGLSSPDHLVESMLCVMREHVGHACCRNGAWVEKPHGRRAKTLEAFGENGSAHIDLSVMPAMETPALVWPDTLFACLIKAATDMRAGRLMSRKARRSQAD